jgi:hypothetical protein
VGSNPCQRDDAAWNIFLAIAVRLKPDLQREALGSKETVFDSAAGQPGLQQEQNTGSRQGHAGGGGYGGR